MSEPVWYRHRVIVDVDVMAVDERGNSFFLGSIEAARKAVSDALFSGDGTGLYDRDGMYRDAWHGQIKIRFPVTSERPAFRDTAEVERLKAEAERQAAEVARLTAEVERLTPKPMTAEESAKVLSDFQHGDHCLWTKVGGGVVGPGFHDFLTETEARYIAQGLLRDGGKGGE